MEILASRICLNRPASHKWCGPALASANAESHLDLHCLLADYSLSSF